MIPGGFTGNYFQFLLGCGATHTNLIVSCLIFLRVSAIVNVTVTVSPTSPPFKNLWWLADGASCRRRLHVDLLHPLPLREVECANLQQDADNRLKLVGGSSLRQVDWDYETHPPSAVFCSGVLASAFVPDCLEHDPALNVMFLPKRLPGSMAIFAGANRLMVAGFASVRHRGRKCMLG